MKSERRHELQTNSLASVLVRTPEFIREHGSKVLLGVIVVLLVAIVIHQRTRSNREQLDSGWNSISTARFAIQRLASLPTQVNSAAEQATVRRQLIETTSSELTRTMDSSNPQIAAESYLLRGDLNWTLANMTDPPEAATQPALKLDGSSEEYLNHAEEAYQKVLRVYADQAMDVANARFGLATIAENRHDWTKAKSIYDEIKNDPNTIPSYKTLADVKLMVLETIQQPVYILPTSQPAAPAQAPAAPAAPATMPAGK